MLPVSFAARLDPDKDVAAAWDSVWQEVGACVWQLGVRGGQSG